MKRLSGIFIISLFLIIKPTFAQQSIPSQQAQPSVWLTWFKSLRTPSKEDALKAQAYVTSKWRCLRYGKNCSKKERAALTVLSTTIAGVVGKFVYIMTKKPKSSIDYTVDTSPQAKALLNAMNYGKAGEVKKILDEGMNPNIIIKDRWTPLTLAALYGENGMLKLLLENKKLDLNAHEQGVVALWWTLDKRNMTGVKNITGAKMLIPYLYSMHDKYGKRGDAVLADIINKGMLSEKEYHQIMRYWEAKEEYKSLLKSKESPLQKLPKEIKATIFEYTAEEPLTPKQRTMLMHRPEKKKWFNW